MLANLHTATHPDEIDSNKLKLQALDFLGKRWNFYSCAISLGMRRAQLYDWIKEDAEFGKAIAELRDGWLDGCEEMNFTEGAQQKNAVTQRIFMLKSHRPEIYGDRYEISNTGTVTHVLASNAEKDLAAYLQGKKAVEASFTEIPAKSSQEQVLAQNSLSQGKSEASA